LDMCSAAATQQHTWLGVEYDYPSQRVRVGAKTLAKLEAVWARREQLTNRQFAGLMGLLFFAVPVLGTSLWSRFHTIKLYRTVAARCQADPRRWEQACDLWPSVLPELTGWVAEVLSNPWQEVPAADATDPDDVVAVDSSAFGWGAVHLDRRTGRIRVVAGAWPDVFLERKASTHAEPMGLAFAAMRLFSASCCRRVLFLTDSTCTKYAFRRGYSPVWNVNGAIALLRAGRPRLRGEYEYVPGEKNVADGPSRGEEDCVVSAEELEALWRECMSDTEVEDDVEVEM
jgi:hypothetical protein